MKSSRARQSPTAIFLGKRAHRGCAWACDEVRRSCENNETIAKGVFSLPLWKSNSGEQPVGLDGSDCLDGQPSSSCLARRKR
jgi:hypothetical protein